MNPHSTNTKINEEFSKPIIEVKNASFSYNKGEWIFHNVSFSIPKGEIIAFAGKSGCGKTTLAYILKGLIPHSIKGKLEGTIIVNGKDIKRTKIATLAKSVGMVFQDLNAQLFSASVQEEIEFTLRNLGMDLENAQEAMKILEIEDLKEKLPMNLSAGQKQKVVLASVIAAHPKVLILDEPSIHLDRMGKKRLLMWLKQINQEQNITIIIIEQDPWLIGEICEKILYFEDNTIQMIPKNKLMEKALTWKWFD